MNTKKMVADGQGLATTTREISFDEVKNAWLEFAENSYEDSTYMVISNIEDGISGFYRNSVEQYLDETSAAQSLYEEIDECESMEDLDEINIKGYLVQMGFKVDKDALMAYALDRDIEEQTANEMCKFLNKEG